MSLGIDTLTATPQTIELGGRTLAVSPLTMTDLGALQAWIYAQLPDPAATAGRMAQGMPADARAAMYHEMYREACREEREARAAHRIGMPAAGALMQGLAGVVELLYLATRKHHPELTRDELPALVLAAGKTGVDRLTSHAFGVDVGGESDADDAGASDPKAGAVGATAASTSTPSS